jgi:hypothetical protein
MVTGKLGYSFKKTIYQIMFVYYRIEVCFHFCMHAKIFFLQMHQGSVKELAGNPLILSLDIFNFSLDFNALLN